MALRSGGRVLVDQLERHGVTRAFCVPGESYLAVLDALHDSSVGLVVCRHEGGAAYMAEAHGKLTGRPGVCLVTRGPGVSNTLVALHTAWQDRTPLLVFVGLIPRRHRNRESFQEMDLSAVFGSTTKSVVVIDHAERIPEYVARAVALARSGRPGPVLIGVPEDMLVDVVDVPDVDPYPVPEGAVSERDQQAITELLAQAQQPLAVVGGSRWSAEASRVVQDWAGRWHLPLAVDWRCQDLVDNESPAYVGYLGYGRDPRLAKRLRDADLVIAVGSPLGDVATDGFELLELPQPGARVVEVLPDADAADVVHRSTMRIIASPAAFGHAIAGSSPPQEPAWQKSAQQAREDYLEFREPVPDGDVVDLGRVFGMLRDRLPGDAIVTFGAGNHALWAQRFLVHRTFPSQLAPRNGSMGYGVPAAVAAAIEHPDRLVVSVAGDGEFLMNGQEIATALANGASLLVLVVNNGQYATIRQHQEMSYPGRVCGTALSNPDFAAYARAFGGHGEVITTTEQFAPALDRALSARTVSLLELRVDPRRLGPGLTVDDVRATGMRAPTDPPAVTDSAFQEE